MALPLVVWALPATQAGAAAAGATFAAGSTLRLRDTLAPFRGGPRTLPPVTGREGTATLEQMIQDAWNGARLPVGFVPPPPGGPSPGDFAAIAAAAAAGAWAAWQSLRAKAGEFGRAVSDFLWGWINSRMGSPVPSWEDREGEIVTVQGAQSLRIEAQWVYSFTGTNCSNGSSANSSSASSVIPWNVGNVNKFRLLDIKPRTAVSQCNNGGAFQGQFGAVQFLDGNNNPVAGGFIFSGTISTGGQTAGTMRLSYIIKVINLSTGQEVSPGAATQLGPRPAGQLPALLPAQAPAIPWPPMPAPFAPAPAETDEEWSATPEADPDAAGDLAAAGAAVGVAAWAPGTNWQPGPAVPAWPVRPAPLPLTRTGTTPAGLPQTQAQAAPAQTPATTHFVNGVAIAAPSARATLAAIATELQRVEEKTANVLRELAKGQDLPISLGELIALVQSLVDLIVNQREAGSYSLLAPCEVDANGDRVEKTADYEGGYIFDQINNKIDALAQLMQHQKDLKQPICGGLENVPGNNVTVHFTEVL